MEALVKNYLCLNEDGTWSKIQYTFSETKQFPFSFALKDAIGTLPMLIKVSPTHLLLAKNSKWTHSIQVLDTLTLNSHYCLINDKMIVFNPEDHRAPSMSLVWKCPEFAKLLFVLEFCDNNAPTGYLLVKIAKRYYRLPLSNQFDDAKLCFGTNRIPQLGESSISEIAEIALETFKTNPFNQDLFGVEKRNKCEHIFAFKSEDGSFTPESLEQVPLTDAVALAAHCYAYSGNLNDTLELIGETI